MLVNQEGLVILNALNNLASVQKSINGINGSPAGTVTYSEDGRFGGNAYTGTSRANQIRFNNGSSLLPNVNEYTLEYWGKPNFACVNGVSPGDHNTFGVQINGSSTVSDYCSFNSNSYWIASGTAGINLTTLNFSASINQHFAFVKKQSGIDGGSDTLRIYVDNALQWSTTAALASKSTAIESLALGTYFEGATGGSGAEVKFDNVKLWNKAKTNFGDKDTAGFDYAKKRKRRR